MTAMPEFERARLDVLAYFLHDDRDVDGGAKAIDDLSFPRLVAIVDAVIRGLVTDPSVAYALAWADAGGTVPDLGATASREAIPAADTEREFRIDAGLFTGPLMVSVSITDLAEVLGLARHNAALLATGHPSKEAFVRVDMAHTDAITPKAEWASGIAYTGELAVTAVVEAAEAIRRGVPDNEVLRHVGDLYAAAQGIRWHAELDHRTPDVVIEDPPMPTGAHRLALASDYKAAVRQHLHALYADLRASKLINLRVEVAADIVVTVVGIETDTITVTETVDVDDPPADPSLSMAAYDRLVDRATQAVATIRSGGMAEHATPEVRADDAIDPVAVVTEAARWVRARLSSSAGIYDQGTYDANSGIKAAENLDRLAALMTASRPATVDDVHRLAEAGGWLAKATDQLRAQALDLDAGDSERRWAVSAVAMGRIDQARESWGHAVRGVYAVPHPRFVDAARKVTIAAGELGAFVEALIPTDGRVVEVHDVVDNGPGTTHTRGKATIAPDHVRGRLDELATALAAFDEVDTAYRADREAHARRIRLSD